MQAGSQWGHIGYCKRRAACSHLLCSPVPDTSHQQLIAQLHGGSAPYTNLRTVLYSAGLAGLTLR